MATSTSTKLTVTCVLLNKRWTNILCLHGVCVDYDSVIGPIFFISFVGIAFLVVLNIIIAIIADAYVEANEKRKVDMKKKKLVQKATISDMLQLKQGTRHSDSKQWSLFKSFRHVSRTTSVGGVERDGYSKDISFDGNWLKKIQRARSAKVHPSRALSVMGKSETAKVESPATRSTALQNIYLEDEFRMSMKQSTIQEHETLEI